MGKNKYYTRNASYKVSRSVYLGATPAEREGSPKTKNLSPKTSQRKSRKTKQTPPTVRKRKVGAGDAKDVKMNHARLLTDQAIAMLESAVIDVLLKHARENGRHAYILGADIGRKMGYQRTGVPGRIHRIILDKLEKEHQVESRSESGRRTGWRLSNAVQERLTRLGR